MQIQTKNIFDFVNVLKRLIRVLNESSKFFMLWPEWNKSEYIFSLNPIFQKYLL